MATINHK